MSDSLTPRPRPLRRSWARWIGVLGAVALILGATLSTDKAFSYTIVVELCTICGERAVADAVVNLLLFVPLGLALAVAGAGAKTRWRLPFLLALCIEIAQIVIPGRFTTLSDIVANTLGGLLGAAIPGIWRWWLKPVAATHRLWLGTALAVATVAANAVLLQPRRAPAADFAHWVPNFENLERWQGQILDARIADVSVPSGWIGRRNELVAALADGAPLQLQLQPAAASHSLAPVFALTDPNEQVSAELLALGDALLWRQRHRGAALYLESAATRFEGAAAAMPFGAVSTLTLRREARGLCLQVNDDAPDCVERPGVGSIWQLFYAPDGWSLGTRRALDLLGLALLLLPAALAWPLAPPRARLGALAVLSATLLLAPTLGTLATPGLAELVAVMAVWLFCWRRRRVVPSEVQLPESPPSR